MESIPVEMRRMIMDQLSSAELLTISLVNKLLNYEARSLMRGRPGLVAKLKSLDPRRDIVPFMSDLATMNVIPFSGINIHLRPPCAVDAYGGIIHLEVCQQLPPTAEWDPTYNRILDRLPWRSLSINFFGSHNIKNSSMLELAKRILKRYCNALEELSLSDNGNLQLLQLIQPVIQDCKFPNLKILKLDGYSNASRTLKHFIKQVVSRAPNLQELHQNYGIDLLENVLEGSSALLMYTGSGFNPVLQEISDKVAGVVRFQTMDLFYRSESEMPIPFTVERFNRLIPFILQSSFATLKHLSIDLVLAVPLMCYGIPLINVTSLGFHVDYDYLDYVEPRLFTILKRFDFTRLFPRLSSVRISTNSSNLRRDHIREFVEQGNAVLQDPQPDRAVNIKHLDFYECLEDDAVPFFAEMFPNVENLSTCTSTGQRIPYQLIWKHWPNLKGLEARKDSSSLDRTRNENLDSVFCGIFPEEVDQLREQDDEYLKAVNIVPVMPAITCCTALRTVRLFHSERGPFRIRINNLADPALHVFSKVTGLLAFQKCPNLAVTIETDNHEVVNALDYMTPYASIVFKDPQLW